ncbi:glycosyltransferase family 4 protein [Falsigemmobacter faecalis]|uniref:Glycosyltransferase n=1 Tax=Falsigemmobacter faecalis TaxID=2488730 RepID=A0A3P3D6G0_9RHOB|nr:glycosyltransferase family 4 protein [Falsigemmobacter faecalis]RRH69032.1 glycosyltransferase [Falsigemmobacter faecalis]
MTQFIDDVSRAVILPPDWQVRLRTHLNVPAGRAPRLAFMAGPGDVVGTYEQWAAGRHDARVPVLSYSAQFYSLVAAIGAEALVITSGPVQPTISDPRFHFVCVGRNHSARGLKWHLAERDYARRLAAVINDWSPDVAILSGDLKPTAYHAVAKRTRLLLTLHGSFWPMGRRANGLKNRVQQWLLGRALTRAEAAVCTSVECARQFKLLAGAGHSVETEMPQVLGGHLKAPRKREKARRLLFLGRIEANKGVFDLLAAFGAIAAKFPDARLTLAGTGSADQALTEAIDRHEAGGQIEFAGLLDAEGVHAALGEADLLVCPTRADVTEGLALVVLEAAVQGVPSVTSSVVPAAETAGAACLTFPADDVAALRTALMRLMEDDDAYTTLAGKAAEIRPLMLDRSLGWGSCLARVLLGEKATNLR